MMAYELNSVLREMKTTIDGLQNKLDDIKKVYNELAEFDIVKANRCEGLKSLFKCIFMILK